MNYRDIMIRIWTAIRKIFCENSIFVHGGRKWQNTVFAFSGVVITGKKKQGPLKVLTYRSFLKPYNFSTLGDSSGKHPSLRQAFSCNPKSRCFSGERGNPDGLWDVFPPLADGFDWIVRVDKADGEDKANASANGVHAPLPCCERLLPRNNTTIIERADSRTIDFANFIIAAKIIFGRCRWGRLIFWCRKPIAVFYLKSLSTLMSFGRWDADGSIPIVRQC